MTADDFKRWAWPPSKANWFFYVGIVAVIALIPGSLVWSASRSMHYYSQPPAIEKKATGQGMGPNLRPVEKPAGL